MEPETRQVGRVEGQPSDWSRLAAMLEVVECEINTACNRRCVYCPQSVGIVPKENHLIDDSVFEWLLDDLERIEFAGRFSHHLFGEPLLHPNLTSLVRRIAARLPKAAQVLFTNGDLLTDDLVEELVEAGIALVAVTRHERGPYPQRRHQAVQYARELRFTSRGGTIPFLLKKKRREVDQLRKLPCHAPSEMAIVTWDGLVLRCYEDARREGQLGDLKTHTLAAIWAASEHLRAQLVGGARCDAGGPCSTCDNGSHASAGQSFATEPFWQKSAEAMAVASGGRVGTTAHAGLETEPVPMGG
jgi:2-deoxy-scyllo-inosamine dehydrogenase (SAM-dependent)